MPRYSLDEFNLFEREEAARLMARREELRAQIEVERAKEEELATARRARAADDAIAANKRLLLRQYEAAGVAPPSVDGDGYPTCSLPMLFSLGWSVEEVGGHMELIAPHHLRGKIEQEG